VGEKACIVVRDASTYHKDHETAVSDTAVDMHSRDGERSIKSKYRSVKMPAIGDKYATRHVHKGCNGRLENAENLPVTGNGMVPDIIVNPHAYPSRMTFVMHLEGLKGIAALLDFNIEDGTLLPGRRQGHQRANGQAARPRLGTSAEMKMLTTKREQQKHQSCSSCSPPPPLPPWPLEAGWWCSSMWCT
jgi:DNA-directed RNA polymerase beta subunit